jgi:hypothetical protein
VSYIIYLGETSEGPYYLAMGSGDPNRTYRKTSVTIL